MHKWINRRSGNSYEPMKINNLQPKISLQDLVPLGRVSLLGLRPLLMIPLVHLGPLNPIFIHVCALRRPRNTFDAIFKTSIPSISATTL